MKIYTIFGLCIVCVSMTFSNAQAAAHDNHGAASSQSLANSNGIRGVDRDKGFDRASDRRSIRSVDRRKGKKHNRH